MELLELEVEWKAVLPSAAVELESPEVTATVVVKQSESDSTSQLQSSSVQSVHGSYQVSESMSYSSEFTS